MDADEISRLVIDQYIKLPAKGKPLIRSNNVKEWTVSAGVVIRNSNTNSLECVALATGVKALPDNKLATSAGRFSHDCHAEISAIRAFNRYVIDAGIQHINAVYLYICAPPCGDASMSLLNGGASWNSEDHDIPKPGDSIRGRAHFNSTGHIRTKPGRGDSPLTMSKSCTDKSCLRQNRGLLLSPVRQIYNRLFFIDGLVCPVILPDFERAFSRFDPVKQLKFYKTQIEFEDYHPDSGAPSPISLAWWATGRVEIIANGILQGSKGKPSELSRLKLAEAARVKCPATFENMEKYSDSKASSCWPDRWERTSLDDFAF